MDRLYREVIRLFPYVLNSLKRFQMNILNSPVLCDSAIDPPVHLYGLQYFHKRGSRDGGVLILSVFGNLYLLVLSASGSIRSVFGSEFIIFSNRSSPVPSRN